MLPDGPKDWRVATLLDRSMAEDVRCVALATAVARAAIAVVVRGDVASGMAVGCAMETKGPHLLQGHGGANDASKVKS